MLEWGHASLANNTDESNVVGTNHYEHRIHLLSDLSNNGYIVSEYSHNHPLGDPSPSGSVGSSGGDIGNANWHEARNPGIYLYTYTKKTGYTRYNRMGCQDNRMLNYWLNASWQMKNK